jgi:heat-inducible transcriptional repressor
MIAEQSGIKLSSATIRNILQELEDEGYLKQPHSSAGREPTDKGYRFYVDYLMGIQHLAATEKEKIEKEYGGRVAELDTLLVETSKLLSKVSNGTGLVFSAPTQDRTLRRLELVPMGGPNILGLLVSEAGFVRHWPIRLSFEPTERQLGFINRFLNERVRGLRLKDVQATILEELRQMEADFNSLHSLVSGLFDHVSLMEEPDTLYVGGADHILVHSSEIGNLDMIQRLMRMLTEKRAFAELLEQEMVSEIEPSSSRELSRPRVRIGDESGIPELAGLSLITQTYNYRGQPVGVLGILGSKRMEYPRMMSLVDYLSERLSSYLKTWEDFEK